jgi:putative glutamine amidotransferase
MTVPRILVGVTQRVIAVPARGERRDALDQAWVPFLADCGLEPIPVPNRLPDPAGYLRRLGVRGVILSGGGNVSGSLGRRDGLVVTVPSVGTDFAPERDVTETALLRASIEDGWPVIGVCRGMQAMNLFHGGRLSLLSAHAGTRHALTRCGTAAGLKGLDFDAEVNSFHDFGIAADGVGQGLIVLAVSDSRPEAFMHSELQHLGIMWHPERNAPFSPNDVRLFAKFFGAGGW